MGLCKGLGAIYSGSYGESALLIVRAKGEWKMCLLPLQSRLWGRGLLLETPGAGTSPHTSSLTRATVICTTAEPGIKGLPRATGSSAISFSSALHSWSGGPRTTRLNGEAGKSDVTEMSCSCPQPVWQSHPQAALLEAQAGILAVSKCA